MSSRQETLAQLQEVCGLEEEAAKQLLEATGWKLEDALALHFAGDDAGSGQAGMSTSSSSPPSRPGEATQSSTGSPDAAQANAQAQGGDASASGGGWLSTLGGYLATVHQAILGIASEDFEDWFLSRFGRPAPAFSKASFGDAVQAALQERRLLLAWFHQEEGPACDSLCRNVLQSEVVLDVLKESFTLWAGDISRFEPAQISRLLGLVKFPALVVMMPQQNGFSTNQFCVEWPLGTFSQPLHRFVPDELGAALDSDMVIAALATTAQDYRDEVQSGQEEQERRSLQLAEDRALREQQDREYEEGLLQDQLAAIQRAEEEAQSASLAAAAKAEEEAVASKAEAEAAARAEAEKAERRKAEEEEEAQRQRRAGEILAQPEAATSAGAAVARLRLQLPSGDRLQRAFKADQTLEEVYEWAHCCRPKPEPKHFELCISFPARVLSDRSATLKELDLVPSAALVLKEA